MGGLAPEAGTFKIIRKVTVTGGDLRKIAEILHIPAADADHISGKIYIGDAAPSTPSGGATQSPPPAGATQSPPSGRTP